MNPVSTCELLVGVAIQLVRLRNGCPMIPYIECSAAACFPSFTVLRADLLFIVFSACRSEIGQTLRIKTVNTVFSEDGWWVFSYRKLKEGVRVSNKWKLPYGVKIPHCLGKWMVKSCRLLY